MTGLVTGSSYQPIEIEMASISVVEPDSGLRISQVRERLLEVAITASCHSTQLPAIMQHDVRIFAVTLPAFISVANSVAGFVCQWFDEIYPAGYAFQGFSIGCFAIYVTAYIVNFVALKRLQARFYSENEWIDDDQDSLVPERYLGDLFSQLTEEEVKTVHLAQLAKSYPENWDRVTALFTQNTLSARQRAFVAEVRAYQRLDLDSDNNRGVLASYFSRQAFLDKLKEFPELLTVMEKDHDDVGITARIREAKKELKLEKTASDSDDCIVEIFTEEEEDGAAAEDAVKFFLEPPMPAVNHVVVSSSSKADTTREKPIEKSSCDLINSLLKQAQKTDVSIAVLIAQHLENIDVDVLSSEYRVSCLEWNTEKSGEVIRTIFGIFHDHIWNRAAADPVLYFKKTVSFFNYFQITTGRLTLHDGIANALQKEIEEEFDYQKYADYFRMLELVDRKVRRVLERNIQTSLYSLLDESLPEAWEYASQWNKERLRKAIVAYAVSKAGQKGLQAARRQNLYWFVPPDDLYTYLKS